MIKLKTVSGEELSKILKEVSPIKYVTNKQINKLLDGSYHVQIIGSSLKSIEATIISSYNQADKLNFLIDQGEVMTFTFLEKKYLVYIEEQISWARHNFANGNKNKSYFEGKILMIIKEEMI